MPESHDLPRCGDATCRLAHHVPAGRGQAIGDNLELVETRDLAYLAAMLGQAIAAERDRPIVTESELRLLDGNR